MTDDERRAIEQDCLKLIASYALGADHHDADRFVNVFARDGQWIRPTGKTFSGHAELRAFMAQRPRTVLSRHVSTNAVVDVLGPEEAQGVSLATVYRLENHEGGPGPLTTPESIVEYQDRFTREPEGWRIKERRAFTVFRR
jgi:uncharacterized protein (TIGR02246 family)